ncbi:MAG: hypothetical protein JXA99_00320 [Candidatus Lokiarchaeota archaeon]|nr:hypothetical protein [Candidatus Lokiarchaeota archaeon]
MGNQKSLFIIFIFLFILLGFISIKYTNPHYDELKFHLPTTQLFYNGSIINSIFSTEYQSANTPLPYIFVSLVHKAINVEPTLVSVRLINIIVSLLTIFVFYLLVKDKFPKPIIPLLILFFYPYYLKPSFAFFMAIYGLLFYFLFIYFVKKDGIKNKIFASCSISLSILSQQFYLIILLFYFVYEFYNLYKLKEYFKFLKEHLFIFLCLVPCGVLFYLWGGFSHPLYQFHSIGFNIECLTSVLVVMGVTLFPFVLYRFSELSIYSLILIFIISISLAAFAFPFWINNPTIGGISGYTFKVIHNIESYSFLLSLLIKTTLVFFGLITIKIVLLTKNDILPILKILFLAMIIGFSINVLASERHMLPLVATGYLITLNKTKEKIVERLWLPYQFSIGSIYFIYITFLYSIN